MRSVFRATLLGRHEVQYFCCYACSFLQTEEPYWLEEAYNAAIADCDTGIMERNLHNAVRISAVLKLLKCEREPIVDMAGGYGILTRLLRDVGFDCRWSDKYCGNILSKGFQAAPEQKAAVLCALEVLEHVEDPLGFLRDAIAQYGARAIVFSTEDFKTVPDSDWWYYSRDSGQHISFYSVSSLEALAKQLGWFYTSLPRHLHLFTASPVAGLRGAVLKSYLLYPYALWALLRMRHHSRTHTDRELLAKEKDGVG
ncbi:MAG: class I SAM-dependent methyltransferase [Kiritimatiellales bacterium]|nr:class I SAM-dependent methyltransferase [Kiritimatiellales bacterium]MCF7863512.1 class I SAM-dependent methyltransferase [Kiritimatiellales bacterium]